MTKLLQFTTTKNLQIQYFKTTLQPSVNEQTSDNKKFLFWLLYCFSNNVTTTLLLLSVNENLFLINYFSRYN